MLKLQFKDRRQKAIWLVDESFTIGSASNNQLVIDETGVAPVHAEIKNVNNQIVIQPADIKLIVKVNGERLSGAKRLQAGDLIQLANVELEIIDPKSEKKTTLGVSAQPASAQWQLKATASWMTNKLFPVTDKITIGRDPECEISVKVEHLSRKHAEIEIIGGRLHIKDLGSSNGTYINGKAVKEGFANPGDKLKFDVVTFEVIGPDTDPNKTIIRTAGPASASQEPKKNNAHTGNHAAVARATAPATTKPDTSVNATPKKVVQPAKKPPVAMFIGIGFVITLAAVAAIFLT